MKRITSLLLTLCLLLSAAGAMAEDLPFTIGWEDESRTDAPVQKNYFSAEKKDFAYQDGTLYICSPGLKVSDWGSADSLASGRIVMNEATLGGKNVTLTIENVHIESPDKRMGAVHFQSVPNSTPVVLKIVGCTIEGTYGVYSVGGCSTTVNVSGQNTRIAGVNNGIQVTSSDTKVNIGGEGTTITCSNGCGIYAAGNGEYGVATVKVDGKDASIEGTSIGIFVNSPQGSASVKVTGEGATVMGTGESGTHGICVSGGYGNSNAVTLGADVTVGTEGTGEDSAAVYLSDGNGSLEIDDGNPNVCALVEFPDGSEALYPADKLMAELFDETGYMRAFKGIRTMIQAPAGSLPQTGDSSSLALWGAALAVSILAMGLRKRREA